MRLVSTEEQLEDLLSEPYPEDLELARSLEGDVIVLGAGGKMGPTLVRRLVRALSQVEKDHRVFAASRFSNEKKKQGIAEAGAVPIAVDLLDSKEIGSLPDCPNLIYLLGSKFGTTGDESTTWACNAFLPGLISSQYRDANIVVLSTGNVYQLMDVTSGGAVESSPFGPIGEYAQSCVGRERVFEFFSRRHSTPVCLLRLNYAVEPRYGVLLDIANRVSQGFPVSLEMGYFNAIWQGDANSACLRALNHCSSPPTVLNITGSETLSVRSIAMDFANRFHVEPVFSGEEKETALLSNSDLSHKLFGQPRATIPDVLDLIAHWVQIGGPTLDKPTHFEVRDGRF